MAGRDDAPDAGRGVHIGIRADDGAGVQDAVAADLYPVAQHGAHLFTAGLHLLRAVLHHHQKLVALDIGGDGAGAHVGLIAKDRIPHIVVMRHLHIIKQNNIFKLRRVAHHAVVPHKCASPDESTGPNLRPVADNAGAGNIVIGIDHGVFGNIDPLGRSIILLCRQAFAQLQNKVFDSVQHLVGVRFPGEQGRCQGMGKIQQVLYNLLDNAIKFSHPDSIIKIETTEKHNKVFVSVKDSGIGIPKDDLKLIWDRFYKSDLSRGKDKKGTGLGLSITKEIIRAHGEHINVISTEGVGSEFIFSLPIAEDDTEDD